MELDYEEKDIYVLDSILEQLVSNKTIDPISVMKVGILPHTDDLPYAILRFEYYAKILKNYCADEVVDFKDMSSLKSNGKTKLFKDNGGFTDHYYRFKHFDIERTQTDQMKYKKLYNEIKKLENAQKMTSFTAITISSISLAVSIITFIVVFVIK